jgi:molecular chaperone GrpE
MTQENGTQETKQNAAEAAPDQAPSQAASPAGQSEQPEVKLQALEAQVKERDQKYLYLYAEFENYKKRAIKDRSDLLKFGWESTARELLMVVDNLERALAHVMPGTDKNLMAGLEMVMGQFRGALEKGGVTKIESVGKDFDPNLHEAVGQEPSDRPSGQITREELKGYLIHGRLLRPSKVVISSGK